MSVPMKPNNKFDHVYAIIRVDEYPGLVVPTQETISVTKVMWDARVAKQEVDRLNAQRKSEKSHYFLQVTRLERKEQRAVIPATVALLEGMLAVNPRPVLVPAESSTPDPVPKVTFHFDAASSVPVELANRG
jgi:hypothetical protein